MRSCQSSPLYLIRHAESEANVDAHRLRHIPNPLIPLTQTGIEQARETGGFLSRMFQDLSQQQVANRRASDGGAVDVQGDPLSVKFWVSPYRRTQETFRLIREMLTQCSSLIRVDFETTFYLSERQLGLLDDHPHYSQSHAAELAHFQFNQINGSHFFVKPALGESPMDLCMRLDFFRRCVFESNPEVYDAHVFVTHGAVIKGFQTLLGGLDFHDFNQLSDADNGSVMLFRDSKPEILFSPVRSDVSRETS